MQQEYDLPSVELSDDGPGRAYSRCRAGVIHIEQEGCLGKRPCRDILGVLSVCSLYEIPNDKS